MRLIGWNILAGGGTRVREIAAALLDRGPEAVVLSEFHGNRSGRELAWLLERGGLVHQAQGSQTPSVRGVFVASRAPMALEAFPEWPAPEAFRIVSARVPGLRVIGTYFPAKAPFIAEMFEPLLEATPRLRSTPTLLLGDLNAGLNGADTERAPFSGAQKLSELLDVGWLDLWRSRNPDAREFTWYSPGAHNGFRLDHALFLGETAPRAWSCRYDHSVREQGFSDHSLLELEIDLGA